MAVRWQLLFCSWRGPKRFNYYFKCFLAYFQTSLRLREELHGGGFGVWFEVAPEIAVKWLAVEEFSLELLDLLPLA